MSRKCVNEECPYNSDEPCEVAEGCAGYEQFCKACAQQNDITTERSCDIDSLEK